MNTPVNPLDPQGDEGVFAAVNDMVEDIEARLENIKAVKGRTSPNLWSSASPSSPLSTS